MKGFQLGVTPTLEQVSEALTLAGLAENPRAREVVWRSEFDRLSQVLSADEFNAYQKALQHVLLKTNA